jgi:hypothetical protein
MVAWAREHVPNVNGRRETAKFVDYWLAATGQNSIKSNWVAAWRNWMRKADEQLAARASPTGTAVAVRDRGREATSTARARTAIDLANHFHELDES